MAWLPNVNPNELITSAWGNQIHDRTVTPLANVAERNSSIVSPAAGMACWLNDIRSLQIHNGSAWNDIPGLTRATYAFLTANSGSVSSTALAIPGLAVSITTVGTRRIKLTVNLGIAQTGGPSLLRLSIREAATQYAGAFKSIISGGFEQVTFGCVLTPAAGAHTYEVYFSTDVGTAVVSGSTIQPSFHLAEDIGSA